MIRALLLLPLLVLPVSADLIWLDIDDPAGSTAPLFTPLAGTDGASVTTVGVTYTLFGGVTDSRDRGLADPMVSDFAYKDGFGAGVGLRIAGLPAGTYDVESWHYDGGGFAGAIAVEFREQGGLSTTLVDNFVFAETPATYQITADGSTTYELIFREDDGNNRSRFNGLKIRTVGATPSPPFNFLDANDGNTVAEGGSPAPFWTASSTSDNLWKKRDGFGFDVLGNSEVFEKDAGGGVGDAALLRTTVTGLDPGVEYGVYACFLSVPDEAWRVRAGLSADALTEFRPTTPEGQITDLGLSGVANSNRHQYLGFIGNIPADASGTIVVHIDDGDGTGSSSRTWYEGVAVGLPYTVPPPPPLPGGAVEVAPDGAWTWFNDERAIFHGGYLFAGYVLGDGRYGVTRYDPATDTSSHAIISTGSSQQKDDHNNPSLTVLPDGRILAVYSKHGSESRYHYRISNGPAPATVADWGPEQQKATPARNTYANTYRLSGESDLIYNFHRCINFNPTLTFSTDNGATWGTPTHFIETGAGGTRPYPRYCSNHTDRIDLVYTDGHPRNDNNSIYHLYYRAGQFRATDGAPVKALADIPLDHDGGERGTVVYGYSGAAWGPGDGPDDWIPGGRAWTWDICYGADGHPVCVFQVQRDNVTGSGWNHDRIYYYYARWTGTAWQRRFIAQAGRGLYSSEDDYGGGMTIDPDDPRVIYISSNAADPFALGDLDNVPLAPDERYEIWRGFTPDEGLTFEWTPVTQNSTADNLRPIVPEDHGRTRQLLWFYGTYNTYTSFDTRVIGIFDEEREEFFDWQTGFGIAGASANDDSDGDGLEDLAEYALGGDPTDGSDTPLPVLDAGGYSFRHVSSRTDLETTVETSTDLENWATVARIRAGGLPNEVAAGFTLGSQGGDPEVLQLSPAPPDAGPHSYVRLRVTQMP